MNQPGYDGKYDPVPDIVDSPPGYQGGDKCDRCAGGGMVRSARAGYGEKPCPKCGGSGYERQPVVKNLRESNAATLRLGPAQAQAYDRVWRLYYMMGYWRNGAIDPTKEPVDCQQAPDPHPEGAAHASKEIEHLAEALGDDWLLIEQTCLWGRGFKEVAQIMYGKPTRPQIDEARFHVKHAYNRLCVELGLSQAVSVFDKLKMYRRKSQHLVRTKKESY